MDDILEKIFKKNIRIAVLGLGRVGLPLACVFASKGIQVVGIDINKQKIDEIQKGICPFYDPPLEEILKKSISLGTLNTFLKITEDVNYDVIFVTVGTPNSSDNNIDYSQLYGALNEIVSSNVENKMIIMRSTLPPRTTEDIIIPFIEQKTGKKIGDDLYLAMCPERILEGQAVKEIHELPEIIGGVNEKSNKIATEIFKLINSEKKFSYTSTTGAELSKLFANIYRYIIFALSNEFGIWAEKYGLDATELIKISNYEYPRSNIPIPGFVGGPCLSKDGTFLDNNTTFSSIVSAAWKLNESIPQHIVNNIKIYLKNFIGKKIAILGIAFKAGSDDTRNSPSVKLVKILKGQGANVAIHDPHVKDTEKLLDVLSESDVVIIATNHKEFHDISEMINDSGCKMIYDVWGMYSEKDFPNLKYARLGRDFNL